MYEYYLKPEHADFLKTKLSISNRRESANIIKMSVKKIQEFFTSVNFKKNEWPYSQSELDYLVGKKILYFIEKDGFYLLTYKGLAILEYNFKFTYELDNYLNDLNSLLFEKNQKTKDEPLKSRDRVTLLTVLGLYAFSPDYSLVVNESNKNEFAIAADFAIEILKQHHPKYVNELDKYWDSNVIGEDTILSNLRRLDQIPKKTGNIFKTASRNKHGIYVDILDEDGLINENRALFLLKKVFDKKIFDIDNKQQLIETLNKIEKGSFTLIQSKNTINKIKLKRQLRDIIIEKL
ncbi:MAG: hypothetical protein JXA98_02600 [Methanosarcinaceae archaeon]|nr:hypothetical protein [Methanosarcinaceae archaeon]